MDRYPGRWYTVEEIARLNREHRLHPLFRECYARLCTVVNAAAPTALPLSGERRYPIRGYKPAFTLRHLQEMNIEFDDPYLALREPAQRRPAAGPHRSLVPKNFYENITLQPAAMLDLITILGPHRFGQNLAGRRPGGPPRYRNHQCRLAPDIPLDGYRHGQRPGGVYRGGQDHSLPPDRHLPPGLQVQPL